MSDQKNMILAIALSVVILIGFQFLAAEFGWTPTAPSQQAIEQGADPTPGVGSDAPVPPTDSSSSPTPSAAPAITPGGQTDRAAALAATPRIEINTPTIDGSISLVGARIDDVVLDDYQVTLDPNSEHIHLLEPTNYVRPYYAEFGWVAAPGSNVALPGPKTQWETDATELAPGSPVTLTWTSPQGLTFKRTIGVDDGFLFTITDTVTNGSDAAQELFPYGLISRGGLPETTGFYILHEGPLGVFDDTLKEVDYGDLQEDGDQEARSAGGWIGITDKYWLAALVPDQQAEWSYKFRHSMRNQNDRFQVDYLGGATSVAAGGEVTNTSHFFAGAKRLDLLDKYEEQIGVPSFDLAIDFGWFYFLTKPFFIVLTWLHGILGNFGLAILALTVVIKLIFFPLANKSYKSMAKMKELTPKLQEMREKYGDDRQRLNEEMMAMYKREKVNPAAGCLPIVVQIPVFFSLYKVLFVSIEMRHSPFYGWIRDLSAPDPTTLFNLFGLIPWSPPAMLMIGAWPVLMGLTMYLQQRLNPQPADPVQAKVFMFLPLLFTFLLSSFAAGLVIYWTWNNLLSILQQWVIMKRMGVKNALS
ncbi:membrane protein insertase YidC [Thalassobaculum litoreum]|uniref:Membrane protein insertase YidC n=1 Tax=Thalassobaculum litoreum DSM 18839 TaxID=1123362 RepID=A0A8G2BFG0_9PROT|nr:membrane protein insertase YidC [Thalassobaculum litoreum]SDF38520.1 YidC/Oxa1 family membrane protein insertase [Thalassobaculum litoreum DSM 18839]